MATNLVSVEIRFRGLRYNLLLRWCAPIIATLRDFGVDVSEMVDALCEQMLDCAEYRIGDGKWQKLSA